MFHHKAFQPVSFSVNAFRMAQEESTGRSGYYRLFFAEMQEESLKKDKEKNAEKRDADSIPSSHSKVKQLRAVDKVRDAKKQRPVKVAVSEAEEPETALPPFRLKPIFEDRQPELQYLQFIWLISQETTLLLQQVEPLVSVVIRGKIKAANDIEEYNRRVLLLAA